VVVLLFWGAWAGLCGLPRGARGDAVVWVVDMLGGERRLCLRVGLSRGS
jgi:hypothetical protein